MPEPAKKDPTNWRKVDNSLPSGARRAEEKAPEGAWGSAAAGARVSREALQEAGAVPQARAQLTAGQRVVRYTTWAGVGVFVAVIASLGYLKWTEVRETKSLDGALAYAASDSGKAELGRDGRAAVHRLAGEYYLRKRDADGTKSAHDQFGKGLGLLGPAAEGGSERDALLQDLALAEVDLGGPPRDVDAGLKVNWDDVQKELHAALRDMRASEARLEALRAVARRLAAAGQAERATALVSSLYPSANAERAEALGAVGLELRAAHVPGLPEKVADQLEQMYAAEKDRPALAPAATALLAALGREPPEPGKKGSKWEVDDKVNGPLGRAEGLARAGKWGDARSAADALASPEAQLRAYVALAAAALEDKTAGPSDATTAMQKAPNAPKASPWLLLRLARIGAKAGVAPDSVRSVADLIRDPDLRGRAQLTALEAQLAQTKQAADPKVLDAVDAATLSARPGARKWARHNSRYSSGTAGVIKGWDAPIGPSVCSASPSVRRATNEAAKSVNLYPECGSGEEGFP